jgi:hypothetical protein
VRKCVHGSVQSMCGTYLELQLWAQVHS